MPEHRDDPLQPDVLDAWALPAPPADFADRVVSAHTASSPRGTAGAWKAAVAALLLLGVGLVLVPMNLGEIPPEAASIDSHDVLAGGVPTGPGEPIQCTGPDEVSFGDRGRARLDAKANLTWRFDEVEGLQVEQQIGNVSYRMEAGESVFLKTPGGETVVRGGEFVVDVAGPEDANRAWIAAEGAEVQLSEVDRVQRPRRLDAGERTALPLADEPVEADRDAALEAY